MWPTEYSRSDNKWCLRQGHRAFQLLVLAHTLQRSQMSYCVDPKDIPKEQGRRREEQKYQRGKEKTECTQNNKNVNPVRARVASCSFWPSRWFEAWGFSPLEECLIKLLILHDTPLLLIPQTPHPCPYISSQKSLVFPWTFRNTIQTYCLISSRRNLWWHRDKKTTSEKIGSLSKSQECQRQDLNGTIRLSSLCPLWNLLNLGHPGARPDSRAPQHSLQSSVKCRQLWFCCWQTSADSCSGRRHSKGIHMPSESWNALCFIKATSKHLETYLRNTEAILTFTLKMWFLASRVKVKCWGCETNVFEEVMCW